MAVEDAKLHSIACTDELGMFVSVSGCLSVCLCHGSATDDEVLHRTAGNLLGTISQTSLKCATLIMLAL